MKYEPFLLSSDTDSGSGAAKDALSREAQLLQSAPSAIAEGVLERARTLAQDPQLLAEQYIDGAIIGSAVCLAARNPSSLWGISGLFSRSAARIGTILLVSDTAQCTAQPLADAWSNRQDPGFNSRRLGDGLGSMLVDCSVQGLAGISASKIAPVAESRLADLLSNRFASSRQLAFADGAASSLSHLETLPYRSKGQDSILQMSVNDAIRKEPLSVSISTNAAEAIPPAQSPEAPAKKTRLEYAQQELERTKERWCDYMGNNPHKFDSAIKRLTREVARLEKEKAGAARALAMGENLAKMDEPERIKFSLNTWYYAAKHMQIVEFENTLYQRQIDSSQIFNGGTYSRSGWLPITEIPAKNKLPILREKDVHYNPNIFNRSKIRRTEMQANP